MDKNTTEVPKSGSEVRLVTIAGKEVELKYETRRKRIDIFGLHSNPERKFGERKSKFNDSLNRNKFNNSLKNEMIDERSVGSLRESPSSNNLSISSLNSSLSKDSNYCSNKLNKILKRCDSDDHSLKKNELSIQRIADKMKKDREPVKMENRFDMLLTSTEGQLLEGLTDNYRNGSKISAKKKKKLKSKIDNKLLNNSYNGLTNYHNNSDENDDRQELIAQNVVSLQTTVDSNHINQTFDELFKTNTNSNHNNNYVENEGEKQVDYKYSKPEFTDNNYEVNEQDLEVGHTVNENQIKFDDELVFKKLNQNENINHTPNGLPVKGIRLRNNFVKNKDKNKSINKEINRNEPQNDRSVNLIENSSANKSVYELLHNWFFITIFVLIFLVIYSYVILNQFCDCTKAS